MQAPISFEAEGARGFYRPTGEVSTGQLADIVNTAVAYARWREIDMLLVNISEMTGFDSPGPAYRRWAARRWSETAGPGLRVALVARAEHICPEKTGLLIAAEMGLMAHICATEPEAMAWLDGTEGIQ